MITGTLFGKDIKIDKWLENDEVIEVMKVWLKSPKEDKKGHGVMIEIFETKSELCPVASFDKWKAVSKAEVTHIQI